MKLYFCLSKKKKVYFCLIQYLCTLEDKIYELELQKAADGLRDNEPTKSHCYKIYRIVLLTGIVKSFMFDIIQKVGGRVLI